MSKEAADIKTIVIIPAYNEADNIADVIQEIHERFPTYFILVINDGSIDNTREIALATGHARVVDLSVNLGIGAAVQTGFKFARDHGFDMAIQCDGDGQHMVPEIPKITAAVGSEEVDCMIGSRFIQDTEGYKAKGLRRIGIRLLEWASIILIQQKIKDQTSGFRAFNKKCIHFLAEHYPSDFPEPEAIILLGKNDFIIKEVFTQMRERQGGISSIPIWRSPFYMTKVLLAMFMASIREKKIENP